MLSNHPNSLSGGAPLAGAIAGQALSLTGSTISSTHRVFTIVIPTTTILTAASPADLVTVSLPTGITRWIATRVYLQSITAAGTLALCTVDIRTATGGGGASLLSAATALNGLTTLNLAQSIAVAAIGSVQTAAAVTMRQTVNSGNAGTIAGIVEIIDLT